MANNDLLIIGAAVALLVALSMGGDTETTKIVVHHLPPDDPDMPMSEVEKEMFQKKTYPSDWLDQQREQQYLERQGRDYEGLKAQYDNIVGRLLHFKGNLTKYTRETKRLTEAAVAALVTIAGEIESLQVNMDVFERNYRTGLRMSKSSESSGDVQASAKSVAGCPDASPPLKRREGSSFCRSNHRRRVRVPF